MNSTLSQAGRKGRSHPKPSFFMVHPWKEELESLGTDRKQWQALAAVVNYQGWRRQVHQWRMRVTKPCKKYEMVTLVHTGQNKPIQFHVFVTQNTILKAGEPQWKVSLVAKNHLSAPTTLNCLDFKCRTFTQLRKSSSWEIVKGTALAHRKWLI